MKLSLIPRPGILEIEPYVGGEASAPGANRVLRLASNENTFGCSPKATAAYQALAGDLHRYPDGGSLALRQAIAMQQNLPFEQLVCGAGSDELISLITRIFAGPGDEVLFSAHGFLMYPICAHAVGATPVSAPEYQLTANVDALLGAVTAKTKLLFLANPNNPTGSLLPAAEVTRLHQGLPGTCVLVLDSAYAEYVEEAGYDDGRTLAGAHDNVVMLRTFSKIHGLAALRIGWAFARPGIIDLFNRVRGPFNTTAASQAAAVAAMGDSAFVETSRKENAKVREAFRVQVSALGLIAHPSHGNFVLVEFPKDSKPAAAEALETLRGKGILVRAMTGYGLPNCLRVSMGSAEDMDLVTEALKDFLG